MQWIILSLNLCLASFAAWAAITARSTLKELRQRLAARSTRSLMQLDVVVSEHESALSSMSTTLRRLSSRIGMQDVRARQKLESAPLPTDPTQRKAALRKQLQQGQLRVIHDRSGAQSAEGAD